LHKGDLALLYTDGVIEAMDQNSAEYGHSRLMAQLTQGVTTAHDIVDSVVSDIEEFTLGIPQHDDITMLALRVMDLGEQADKTRRTA
jgi:phosphoserine phosphatase RsbU/P